MVINTNNTKKYFSYCVFVGRLELEEPADVEEDGEEDERDDGDGSGAVRRAVQRVTDRDVTLDGHGQRCVDGACN